jgi:uncharacterized protein (TIGR02246 family)
MLNMDNIDVVISGQAVSEEDKQSVLQLAAELDRRWNEHNARAFAELFTPDGDFRFHTGIWIVGKDAIEKFWHDQVFAGLPLGFRHEVTIKRVRFVTDNIAIGDGTIRIVEKTEGQERVHLDTEATAVGAKKDGRWYFSAVRLTVFAPE